MTDTRRIDPEEVKRELVALGAALGFAAIGVASIEIPEDERHLLKWLAQGFHGEMDYMERHGVMRSRPQQLAPGTVRVVSARMDYWPRDSRDPDAVLGDPTLGYVSRYALGRDYHKILRRALATLASQLAARIGPFGYRVCVDSAPERITRHVTQGWIREYRLGLV